MRRKRGEHYLSLWQLGVLVLLDAGATFERRDDGRAWALVFDGVPWWTNGATIESLRNARLVTTAGPRRSRVMPVPRISASGTRVVRALAEDEVACVLAAWPMHDLRVVGGVSVHLSRRWDDFRPNGEEEDR